MKYLEHPPVKVGIGYDVHRLVEDRDLILGNIHVKHHLGLLGHSDADVAIHALMDAILGALGEDDIGVKFPDTDMQFKDIDSAVLLKEVLKLLEHHHYFIGNIDLIVAAEKPKLNPYRTEMRKKLCEIIGIPEHLLNLKFTTEEGLGFTGREEGISATAVCTIFYDK